MKKSHYTEEQIAYALQQAKHGTPVKEVIRKMAITEQTFYRWKKKYGGLGTTELRRLKQLEEENRQLKRLDAGLEQPWLRGPDSFRHPDLLAWAAKNRGELIWAALTIIQAWIAMGRPHAKNVPMLGMFEQWSKIMGGILEVAGIAGFLVNLKDFYQESDTESGILGAFVLEWYTKYLLREVGVADLFNLVETLDLPIDLGPGSERSQRIRLGKLLGKMRDRQFYGLRVVSAGTIHRAQRWKLEPGHLKPVNVEGEKEQHSHDIHTEKVQLNKTVCE